MNELFHDLLRLDDAAWSDPDGYTPAELDTVIGESLTEGIWEALVGPAPTTAVQDGTAQARRDRRIAQRALGNVVRVLRVHVDLPTTTAPVQAGNEAA